MSADRAADTAPRLSALELVAGFVSAAQRSALEAAMLAEEDDPARRRLAAEMAQEAADQAGSALARLANMGARPAHISQPPPIPLHLLSTPASERLLALLEETLEAAEQVDFERGRSVDRKLGGPSDTFGLDLAESISELALRVRVEVNGPRGSGRE